MQTFMNEFLLFFETLLSCMGSVWNWLISTTLGEILIFIILISIFIFVIKMLVSLKD